MNSEERAVYTRAVVEPLGRALGNRLARADVLVLFASVFFETVFGQKGRGAVGAI